MPVVKAIHFRSLLQTLVGILGDKMGGGGVCRCRFVPDRGSIDGSDTKRQVHPSIKLDVKTMSPTCKRASSTFKNRKIDQIPMDRQFVPLGLSRELQIL